MRRIFVILGLLGLACGGTGSSNDQPPGGIPEEVPQPPVASSQRCPEGVKAIEFWQGEYPGPILDVTAPTVIPGRAQPCDPSPSVECEVPAGIYHPWGTRKDGFVTLRPTVQYRLLRPHSLEVGEGSIALAAGSLVEMTTYLSEGYCMVQAEGHEVDALCPDMWEDTEGVKVEMLNPDVASLPQTQLFLARCTGGQSAWIDVDDTLLQRPTVREGELIGYGEVGPGQ